MSNFDEETREVSVTVPMSLAEDLADHYDALSLPEALRQAADEAVEHRNRAVTPEDVTESILTAAEQGGLALVQDNS